VVIEGTAETVWPKALAGTGVWNMSDLVSELKVQAERINELLAAEKEVPTAAGG